MYLQMQDYAHEREMWRSDKNQAFTIQERGKKWFYIDSHCPSYAYPDFIDR